nr:EpsG family protein [Budvicia aquatica]
MLLLFCFTQKLKLSRSVSIFLCGFLMFFFLSGNYFNGYDWINYEKNYQCFYYNKYDCWLKYEFGYNAIVYLTSRFFENYHAAVIVISLINTYILCWFARRNTTNPTLYIILFFSLYAWVLYSETLRQALALSFSMVALDFYRHNKKNRAYAICIAACLFHVSAIFMFLLFIFERFPRFSITLFVVFGSFILIFIPVLAEYFYMLNPRILGYFVNESWGGTQENVGIIQISSIIFGGGLIMVTKMASDKVIYNYLIWERNCLILFSALYIIFSLAKLYAQYFEVLSRVNYYIALCGFIYLVDKFTSLTLYNKSVYAFFLLFFIFYNPFRIWASVDKFGEYDHFYIDILLLNNNVSLQDKTDVRCYYIENKFSSCVERKI